jgi:TP901 family phage tail tape measure protein
MTISIPIITEFNGKGIDKAKQEFKQLEGVGPKAAFALKKAFIPALAVVGGGVKIAQDSVKAFTDYETKLNEVFTLMPGLSAQAEKEISADVKKFSKEFGVLPNDAIPSLYQAISAGVPRKNVFTFLEVAQKAAKGGVTELSTAVDGISSVVNAYGAEVLSASKASDLMFTAVKLGKTDFTQLSKSMFQVAPIGSALGVGFDEITAALAALTAKGTPTAVAATQMKSAMSELGKEGTKADKAFRKLAGKGFQDFLKGGGSVEKAFKLMADGADKSGLSVLDMFGSIEAGQAVLSLTAGGGEAFSAALKEMDNSAGATTTAFEKMQTGVQPSIDKLKANFEVLKLGIGEQFAGPLAKLLTFISENISVLSALAFVFGAIAAAIVLVNIAMSLNPIALIAGGIVAVVAGLVIAYKKFEGFRKIVDALFGAIRWWVNNVTIPAVEALVNVFKFAFNNIARLWNNTIGKLSFDIPSWVPGLGGKGFSVPKIPMLAQGGIVTSPTLALIGEGRGPEAVIPLDRMSEFGMGGGSNVTINVNGGDPQSVVDALRRYMYQNGTIPIRVSG